MSLHISMRSDDHSYRFQKAHEGLKPLESIPKGPSGFLHRELGLRLEPSTPSFRSWTL